MQNVIGLQFKQLLQDHQLVNFEQLWNYQGDWFEPPNHERGGWSGVNYIELSDYTGKKHGFYLKRQQAHTRRTWQHPFAGEPTFVREFKILMHLAKHNVATPRLVFFESQQNKAILLIEALTGFVSTDVWLEKNQANITVGKQRILARALAHAIKSLHHSNVVHRSLYLKHLFVRETNGDFEVALIDFEKSRISMLMPFLRLSDLITLCRRTPQINKSLKLAFFKQYYGFKQLTQSNKKLCNYLYDQSKSK